MVFSFSHRAGDFVAILQCVATQFCANQANLPPAMCTTIVNGIVRISSLIWNSQTQLEAPQK